MVLVGFFLYLFSKWEGVISLHRQSQDPLVPTDDRMGYRCNSWVTNLQTYAGNIADTLWKEGEKKKKNHTSGVRSLLLSPSKARQQTRLARLVY